MPDHEDLTGGARFAASVPAQPTAFPIKGCGALDWGMQSRLARIFRPATRRTVMLAIDHGYFQGPTSGLERVDLNIVPLLPYADALMTTRGMVRSTIPPASGTPIVLRASGGPSVLRELSNEQIAVGVEDAVRINACAVAVQVFIGGEYETRSVRNMTRLVDAGQRYGIPVLAVTAVGKELTRDARYLRLATRICAELGAHFVKTYYCETGFDTVTAACPVPLVMAGGKKLPELEALAMAYRAVEEGAAGVDMGRNIFQSHDPVAMIRAVAAVVHESVKPQAAHDQFFRPLPASARKWKVANWIPGGEDGDDDADAAGAGNVAGVRRDLPGGQELGALGS
jgi:3-hydroxy-5-phosphonooxypentane-2,4-dione thiolase